MQTSKPPKHPSQQQPRRQPTPKIQGQRQPPANVLNILAQQRQAMLMRGQDKTYHGYNIHSYEQDMAPVVNKHVPVMTELYGTVVEPEEFEKILTELEQRYGPMVTYSNLRNTYRDKCIRDPRFPGLNSAVTLKAMWSKVKTLNDDSIYKHFNETLIQIGSTCIQGISMRLFMDYVTIHE
jgi:hypothetical protein